MLKSLIIALQTYSRIPMPQVDWDDKSMKYVFCFFPLVGAFVGGFEILWFFLAGILELNSFVYAAVAAVIPILVTGAIHMDGFCDTVDALSSHQSRERMLEILKDSHAGAFAIIFCGVWILCYFAFWTTVHVSWNYLFAVCFGFILSRALSGLAIANFKSAREKGMLAGFAGPAKKSTVTITMLVYIVLSIACIIIFARWLGVIIVAVNLLIFWYYKYLSYKKFGGITGDLAGWFLQLCELGTVAVVGIFNFII